jgi:hypothetical protein
MPAQQCFGLKDQDDPFELRFACPAQTAEPIKQRQRDELLAGANRRSAFLMVV